MPWLDWYNSLAKPSWTPAPATIGLIWQILYPIILVSFGFVFVQAFRKKLPWVVALPFAINLVTNLIFTPIQFGMRNLPMGSATLNARLRTGERKAKAVGHFLLGLFLNFAHQHGLSVAFRQRLDHLIQPSDVPTAGLRLVVIVVHGIGVN